MDSLVSALPVIGSGDDRNDWMGGADGRSDLDRELLRDAERAQGAGDFHGISAGAVSSGVDTRDLEGAQVEIKASPLVDYLSVPVSAGEVRSFAAILDAVRALKRVCVLCRANTDNQIGATLLQIASLIEATFLDVLPTPDWDTGAGDVWRADDKEKYEAMRDLLVWASKEYTAVCGSVSSPESHSSRVLTHAAIMVAFYQLVRLPPANTGVGVGAGAGVLDLAAKGAEGKEGGNDGAGDPDLVLCMMLTENAGACFPTRTAAGEAFADVTGQMTMTRPSLLSARGRLCSFMAKMESATGTYSAVLGIVQQEFKTKETEDVDALLKWVDTFNDRLSMLLEQNKDGQHFKAVQRAGLDLSKGGRPPNAHAVLSQNQKPSEGLTEAQRLTAWLLYTVGDEKGLPMCLKTMQCLRDMILRYALGIQSPKGGTKREERREMMTQKSETVRQHRHTGTHTHTCISNIDCVCICICTRCGLPRGRGGEAQGGRGGLHGGELCHSLELQDRRQEEGV